MTKRETTMLRGYARRMGEIARLAAEMNDIKAAYTKMTGHDIQKEDLERVLTGDRLATLLADIRAERPAEAQESEDDVLEPVSDPAPPAGAPALGLVPAPSGLILPDSLTRKGVSGV